MEGAANIAREAVGRYGLDREATLVFDRVQLALEGGGSNQGSGQRDGPFVTGTTVQFRQMINGLPVVTPGAGSVRISVDNDGTVTELHTSTRPIERMIDRPRNPLAAPGEEA